MATNGDPYDGFRYRTLAIGTLLITLAYTGATLALLLEGKPVAPELWTLNVGIVSFYLGIRAATATKP